jgi:chromosome segregation ATPase
MSKVFYNDSNSNSENLCQSCGSTNGELKECHRELAMLSEKLFHTELALTKKDKALALNNERLLVLQTTVECWKKRLDEESRTLERVRSVQEATLEIREDKVKTHKERSQLLETQLREANERVKHHSEQRKQAQIAHQKEAACAAEAMEKWNKSQEQLQRLKGAQQQELDRLRVHVEQVGGLILLCLFLCVCVLHELRSLC